MVTMIVRKDTSGQIILRHAQYKYFDYTSTSSVSGIRWSLGEMKCDCAAFHLPQPNQYFGGRASRDQFVNFRYWCKGGYSYWLIARDDFNLE